MEEKHLILTITNKLRTYKIIKEHQPECHFITKDKVNCNYKLKVENKKFKILHFNNLIVKPIIILKLIKASKIKLKALNHYNQNSKSIFSKLTKKHDVDFIYIKSLFKKYII